MSQVTQPRIPIPAHSGPTRAAWIGALLALAVVAAVALVIALSGGSPSDATPVNAEAQPSLRVDGGPEETGVASAVGTRAAPAPSESTIAASIGTSSAQQSTSAPDESRVAASIGAR